MIARFLGELWNTIWGILGVFRHDRGVHYVYLGTIGGCIITIRGGAAPPQKGLARTLHQTSKMCLVIIAQHNWLLFGK